MAKLKEHALWIISGDILGRGMSFLASIYLARVLGAEYYGLILFGISLLGYANWFSDMGLYQIGSREKAKPPEKRIYRIIEIFNLRLILGVAVLMVSALLLYVIDFDTEQKQVLLGFLISLIPYMFLMEWFYAGKQDFGKITLSKTIQGSVYLGLIVLMVHSSNEIHLAPLFYTSGIMLATIILGVFAISDKPFSLPSRGSQIYPDLFKSSAVIGLGQLSSQVIQLLPPILIGLFMTFEMAGVYGVAFKVVILVMIIDRVFVQLLLPNLASAWVSSKGETNTKIQMTYRIAVCTGSVVALFTALSSEQLITWLFGDAYMESIYLLKILSLFIGFTFINSLFSFGLIATNHDTEYFKATVFGGSISAVLLILASYLGNLTTVTVTVVISEVIITGFTYQQFMQVFRGRYLRPFSIVVTLTVTLYFIFEIIPIPALVSGVIASTILVLALIRINVLTTDDINWIKSKVLT
ncbi:oligosaccharide flippase family protein [Gracilimonas amylolytica]|uniref:oligosaccharide flippase family protein n=1 Tax=Gracilimonas amylolytica TaxID=1749045 RepID=UPI000CD8D447|nr:oligosaccharide flippase family protein [Gracilimonas amylolytica]